MAKFFRIDLLEKHIIRSAKKIQKLVLEELGFPFSHVDNLIKHLYKLIGKSSQLFEACDIGMLASVLGVYQKSHKNV